MFGDISGGASNDIQRATKIARQMVTQLGMSDVLGPVTYGTGESEVFLGRDFSADKNYSEEVAGKIDEEIRALIDDGYQTAMRILTENREKLNFIAEYLLMHETMDGDQFEAAMDRGATAAELEEMAKEKEERSRKENEEKAKAAEKAEPDHTLPAPDADEGENPDGETAEEPETTEEEKHDSENSHDNE